jgi:hypothetical protein
MMGRQRRWALVVFRSHLRVDESVRSPDCWEASAECPWLMLMAEFLKEGGVRNHELVQANHLVSAMKEPSSLTKGVELSHWRSLSEVGRYVHSKSKSKV